MAERRIAEGGLVLGRGPGCFVPGVVFVLGVEVRGESDRVDTNRYMGVTLELVAKAMEEVAGSWETICDAMRMHLGQWISDWFNNFPVIIAVSCFVLVNKLQSDIYI